MAHTLKRVSILAIVCLRVVEIAGDDVFVSPSSGEGGRRARAERGVHAVSML
jgi:hypothetical protein